MPCFNATLTNHTYPNLFSTLSECVRFLSPEKARTKLQVIFFGVAFIFSLVTITRLVPLSNSTYITLFLAVNIFTLVKLFRENIYLRAQNNNCKPVLCSEIQHSRAIISALDQSRISIAAELHDGIGQNLLSIKNGVDRLITQDTENLFTQQLILLSDATQQTLSDSRFIAHQMHPAILDIVGLEQAMESVLQQTFINDVYDIEFLFEINADELSDEQSLQLLRITQEACKNIYHHAQATWIEIKLSKQSNIIHLDINDNGIGIHSGKNELKPLVDGFGIRSMRQRTEILHGQLSLKNNIDCGLHLCLSFPN